MFGNIEKTRLKPLVWSVPAAALAFGGLCLLNQENHLMYHGVMEMVSVTVALTIFAIGWHTRRFAGHSVFSVLAAAYLIVGGLDLLHVLSYPGMEVFAGRNANLAWQLWFAARAIEGISLLAVGILLHTGRRVRPRVILLSYLVIGSILLLLIFPLELFPVAYVADSGFTYFRLVSESITAGIVACAGYLIWRNGAALGEKSLTLLVASVAATSVSVFLLLVTGGTHGMLNTLGHALKVTSLWLMYRVLVARTLAKPCESLYGEVARSTESLKEVNGRLQRIITLNADGMMVVDGNGTILFVNPATSEMLDRPESQLVGHDFGFPVGRGAQEIELVGSGGETKIAEMRTRAGEWQGGAAHIVSLRDVTERKRLEERYRAIFETSGSATIITEPDTTISMANAQFEQLSGYSREEVEGQMSWTQIAAPEDLPQMREYARLRKKDPESAPDNYEFGLVRKDGTRRSVLANIGLLDGSGRVVASLVDITDLKKTEEALRQSEHRFKATFEQAAVGMVLVAPDGQLLRANDRICEILRYTPEELMDKTYQEITHPEDLEADVAQVDEMCRGEIDNYQMEKRYIAGDGSVVWANLTVGAIRDESGDLDYLVSVVEDITKRKQTEAELRIRNRAIESSLNGIAITDLEGTVTSANPAAVAMWGFDNLSEVEGHRAIEFWQSPETARQAFSTTLEEGEWAGEMIGKRRNGSTFPVQVAMSLVTDPQGEATHTVGFFRDITERKKAERELRQAYDELRDTQRQLVDQERQRALSEMASGIAHDFNNALSTVRGFTELLLNSPEKADNREVRSRYLHHIEKAASNAAETVRRMRKFYRPVDDQETYEKLDMKALVEESLSLTRPRWEHEAQAQGKNIKVKKELQNVPDIKGNESELHEMLTNLIFNAVDAIETEGTIILSTRGRNDQVILEVRDTGRGMDEETRQRCLDPFYTTKVETGTGLGLSVTQGIVGRHNGEIEIESQPGEGATFRISLPAAGPQEEAANSEETGESNQALQALVIEDDDTQRELLAELLTSEGHSVDLAANGQDGLKKFDAGWYDLVLTDRAMPQINGDEVARMVKRKAPEKPVIMLTGFGEMMDAMEETPNDIDVVVSKPVSVRKLKDALNQVMKTPESNTTERSVN